MDIILTIILIVVTVVLCNKSKWKSNNRLCPPGTHMDYNQATTDMILKGKDYYYKKHLSGGYDVPDKK